MEGSYIAVDDDDSSCHGYYSITNISYPCNLQEDLSIDGQVISSSEMVCEVTYIFDSISILIIIIYKQKNSITQFFSKYNNQ